MIDLRDAAGIVVTTIAGTGKPGSDDGDGTGEGKRAQLNDPRDVTLDGKGRLFIAENGGHRIRMIELDKPNFPVTTIAGALQGHQDGTSNAAFDHPVAITADPSSGMLYVAESFGHVLRVVDPNAPGHPVDTLTGVYQLSGRQDGTAAAARFNAPEGIAFGPDGNLYVADTRNNLIRRVRLETPIKAGKVETIAGQSEAAAGSNNEVAGLEDGDALAARFSGPTGLAFDARGDLLVADAVNKRVRKVTLSADPVKVETVAGPTVQDLTGASVDLSFPAHLAFDRQNSMYLGDLRLGLLVRLP
jgi:sugar lactone lactonase YvrE